MGQGPWGWRPNGRRGAAVGIVAVLLLSGVGQAVTAPEGSPDSGAAVSSHGPSALDIGAMVTEFQAGHPGGVVLLSEHGGRSVVAAAGSADAGGSLVTAATPFRFGSVGKTLVATMVLQLVAEGKVDLGQPLSTYLPDIPIGGTVTIRDLLRHHSGVPDFAVDAQLGQAMAADPAHVFSPLEVLGYLADDPTSEPGQGFSYSNTDYILLGLLVEALDGTDLDASLGTRIRTPLGLESTHFPVAGVVHVGGMAQPWSASAGLTGTPATEYRAFDSSAWAAGGLVSTVGDLATFLHALFDGKLLSAPELDAMVPTQGDDYGLGIARFDFDAPMYGHTGSIPGYNSGMIIDPATGDLIVVANNNDELDSTALGAAVILDVWPSLTPSAGH